MSITIEPSVDVPSGEEDLHYHHDPPANTHNRQDTHIRTLTLLASLEYAKRGQETTECSFWVTHQDLVVIELSTVVFFLVRVPTKSHLSVKAEYQGPHPHYVRSYE